MKILVCGMPRSMTTWTFNVIRELMGDQPLRSLWLEPNDEDAELDFISAEDPVLGKCHHYSEPLAKAADFVVNSYRDLRTAAVSYHRKFDVNVELVVMTAWTRNLEAWLPFSDVILRYESVECNPVKSVQILREALVSRFGIELLVSQDNQSILGVIDEKLSK